MNMIEYRVSFRKPTHNDEWENSYTTICIKDESGNMVMISEHDVSGDTWSEFTVIPSDRIIDVERIS